MPNPPPSNAHANRPKTTVVDLSHEEVPKNLHAGDPIPADLLQKVVNKYAETQGKPAGETAAELGVTVTVAGEDPNSGNQQFRVTTNVAGGNNQHAGLADDHPAQNAQPGAKATTPADANRPKGPQGDPSVIPTTADYKALPNYQNTVNRVQQDPSQAEDALVSLGVDMLLKFPSGNINALVQLVLMQAYQGNNKDLTREANQVQFYNNAKEQLRNSQDAANSFLNKHLGADNTLGGEKFPVPPDPTTEFIGSVTPGQTAHSFADGTEDGGAPTSHAGIEQEGKDGKPTVLSTPNAINDYVQSLDSKIQTIGGDQQMAQLRLQTLSQNQSTLAQDMSNLSKSVFSTSESIIRNINSG